MEEDVQQGVGLEMTTDRDRVEERIAAHGLEAEIERLTRERDDWKAFANCEASKAVAAQRKAEAAEKELDEARERIDLQASVIDQCETALEFERTRLARARADALEEATRHLINAADTISGTGRRRDPRHVLREKAQEISALADSEPADRAEQEADNA